MNDAQLDECLKTVGKTTFVRHFELFMDSGISHSEAFRYLMKHERYKETSSRTKVSTARRIIEAGGARDALKIIASARVDDEIAAKARRMAYSPA